MNKKKLGFFCLHYDPPIGGAERSMKRYFEYLASDLDIQVFCFLNANGTRFTNTTTRIENGVKIIQSSEPLEKCFIQYVGSNRPDFVATQLLWSDPIVALSDKYGIPCFYFAHGLFEDICQFHLTSNCSFNSLSSCNFGESCPNGTGLKRANQKYSSCKKIFVNSLFTKQIFNRFFPFLEKQNKIELLYPFVDIETFKFKSKTDRPLSRRIMAVNSNFTKGRDVIINISQHLTSYEFVVVNTKEVDKEFFKHSKNIKTLGSLTSSQMAEEYQKSDAVIIPTFMDETFSLVACESILCGTPVVASRKGNLPNIILHGHSGFIVESPDVWDWSDAIEKAINLNISEKLVSEYRKSYNPENGVNILKKEFGVIKTENVEEIKNNFNEMFLKVFGEKWNDN